MDGLAREGKGGEKREGREEWRREGRGGEGREGRKWNGIVLDVLTCSSHGPHSPSYAPPPVVY